MLRNSNLVGNGLPFHHREVRFRCDIKNRCRRVWHKQRRLSRSSHLQKHRRKFYVYLPIRIPVRRRRIHLRR